MSVPSPVELLQTLVRFDTSNHGDGHSAGERECVLWIAGLLRAAGWEPQLLHRQDAPDRLNLVIRVPGSEPDLPGVLVHAHTDVVPVEPEQWSVPPFGAVVDEGYVWGRGAQDMLWSAACMVHTLLAWGAEGTRPRRDVVMAFVADEEDGGAYGAQWLARDHPDLFEGLELAIGEDGGMCQTLTGLDERRVNVYTINAGERGTMHLRLRATGTSGHGSRPSGQDAVSRLVGALHRLSSHRWPLTMSTVVRAHYEQLAAALGHPLDSADEESMGGFVDWLGPEVAGPMRWTIRPSATPTVLRAGYKVNVVPGESIAEVDVRCPPGTVELVDQTLRELLGDQVEWEYTTRGAPLESPITGEWWEAMVACIHRHDPEGIVIPGCMGGGTDNKAFAPLGMDTYGFTPAPPDPDGRVAAGYHGVDERVPVSQVKGGSRMLRDFLEHV